MRLVLWSPLMSVTPNLDPSIASSQVAHGMDASAAASIHSFPFLSYPTLDRKMNHSPPHSSSLSLSLSLLSRSLSWVSNYISGEGGPRPEDAFLPLCGKRSAAFPWDAQHR